VNLLYARQQFQFANIEIDPRAHGTQDSLLHSRTAVNFEAHFYQVINYLLNLFLGGGFLHCDDHN
jgi:hypothetical protein